MTSSIRCIVRRKFFGKSLHSLTVALILMLIGTGTSSYQAGSDGSALVLTSSKSRSRECSYPLVQPDQATRSFVSETYGNLPLSFEANQGQTDGQVEFVSRGSGYGLFLTPTEAVLVLRNDEHGMMKDVRSPWSVVRSPLQLQQPTDNRQGTRDNPSSSSGAALRMRLVGASAQPRIIGLDELPGKVNYFIGNDPTQWRTNIASYAKVRYEGVYPGVDLVYYGNQRHLEYDFVVAPGVDPGAIVLGFEGADNLEVDGRGDLVLHTVSGEVRYQKPVVYQERDGHRVEVGGQFKLVTGHSLQVSPLISFQVGAYDTSKPLVIDPQLAYSTYLGGSGDDAGYSIALDSAGNAYVAGITSSLNFPTVNPLQPTYHGGTCGTPPNTFACYDVFVAKLNPTGSALIYSTYLGGQSDDEAFGHCIAVDAAGNAYVTGFTLSADFPTVMPLQRTFGGLWDAFVAKLNPTGSALIYSTYLGGTCYDAGYGIAVDSTGNAYIAGETCSSNFPIVNGFQTTLGAGPYDAFLAKLSASGTALLYSTYLGRDWVGPPSRGQWGL